MIRISLDWQFESMQAQRPTSGLDTLYKYVRTEHASSIVDKGIFKIGTLYDFRNMELYGSEIGDASEGHKTIFSYDNKEDWNNEKSGKFLKDFWSFQREKNKNNLLIMHYPSSNYYIFCTSLVCNFDAMKEMGYDAVIKIDNKHDAFFLALSRAMHINLRLKPENGIRKCEYRNRTQHASLDGNVHASFIKGTEYEHQAEVRMRWIPHQKIFNPLFITSYAAARLCAIV